MKTIKIETYTISCGWRGCNEAIESDWKLNTHIEAHLADKLDRNDDEDLLCPWNDCQFQTVWIRQLHRHVYYHGYYDGLLARAQFDCDKNRSIPECTLAPKPVDRIPELKDDFRCGWTNCQFSFISIVEYHDHIIRHAQFECEANKSPDDPRPKIICNWRCCNKQLENKYRLIEHTKKHSNQKYAACKGCGEVFRTKTKLFEHLRRQSNSDSQKFQCAQCFKFFATEKLLRSHVFKHVNCYKCSLCDMTCTSPSALAVHVRYRHLKDKPFSCSICNKRCVRESDLTKHTKVHKKVMHHCEQPGCNYAVRTVNILRRHILEVHNNSPYIYLCHCCDKPFKNGKSLSAHLIKKHDFQLPSGHKRFTYRIDANGFYRLETMRIESLEVTQQILTPNPFEVSEVTEDSSCYEIVSKTNNKDQRVIVSNNDEHLSNFIGEVVISIPNVIKSDTE